MGNRPGGRRCDAMRELLRLILLVEGRIACAPGATRDRDTSELGADTAGSLCAHGSWAVAVYPSQRLRVDLATSSPRGSRPAHSGSDLPRNDQERAWRAAKRMRNATCPSRPGAIRTRT